MKTNEKLVFAMHIVKRGNLRTNSFVDGWICDVAGTCTVSVYLRRNRAEHKSWFHFR